MNDITLFPADLAALSVNQLAALPAEQKAEIDRNLDEALDWLKKTRAKLNVAMEACYGEQARTQLLAEGCDTGTTHLRDGAFDVTVEIGKDIKYDSDGLARLYSQIQATGDDPHEYIDVKYAVSERKFQAWPRAMREPFERLRTVTPKSPRIALRRLEGGGP